MAMFDLTAKIRLVPEPETMVIIMKLLDLWQDANPYMMVALVPKEDGYGYEIIERNGKHD